ncbi:hypothetical protein F511_24187 [Dorcoceras hygrometricum]|uniref:Uncharacterized protein n=1 Tax=Dorcoceras hygrometricum TaxID=472368 RepID=A0A2Z7C8W5_9LAMI|nr:hypothetical protein F511_24187 [Dorcoceras hygrometricum]
MVASFFVNAMQDDFESVLAMEHTGMARMFKTLEDTWLKGVVAGTVISSVANRKLTPTKEAFAKALGLPTEGMASFLDIPNQTVVEMRGRFSGCDVPFSVGNRGGSGSRAWLRPVSRGNRHFTVGGGRLRQSGPRSEGRLLRQPALEGLTRSTRTETPRKVGRNKFRRGKATAAARGTGGGREVREEGGGVSFRVRVMCNQVF